MQYLHTMIRISDVDQSLAFFCGLLGMTELRRKEYVPGKFTRIFLTAADDRELAEKRQGPLLELTYNWEPEEYQGGRNFGHLAYQVKNIYQTCQRLRDAGVTINRPPHDGRMAFIKSPDGISIELLQAGDPLPPAEPWASMANSGTW